jgi:vancomycin permeability regulator SanA
VKALRIIATVLLVLVIAVLTVSYFFKQHIAYLYAQNAVGAPYDVVIIPGLPYDAPVPNGLFKARMLWSKSLFDNGTVKHIIYSGSAVHTPYVEGEVMKSIALQMGLPAQVLFAETKALHTTENISYCLQLADSLGFKKIAVATDPFQALFLERHISKSKLPVAILPFPLDSFKAFEKRPWPDFNAENALVKDFVPLKERAAGNSF